MLKRIICRIHSDKTFNVYRHGVPKENQLPAITIAPHRITEFLEKLKQGISITKHGRRGKPKTKILTLDQGEESFTYYPSAKVDSIIYLKDIKVVQTGHNTKVFQRHAQPDQEQFAVSFVMKSGHTFDFEVESALAVKLLVDSVTFAILNKSDAAGDRQKVRLIRLWFQMGKENDRNIAFAEVPRLVQKLGLNVHPLILQAQLHKHDADRSGDMQFNEFQTFVMELTDRPEIKAIFHQYGTEKGEIHAEDFTQFMVQMQKEERWTDENSRHLFKALNTADAHVGSTQTLSMERFIWFLGDNTENNCISPIKLKGVTQDMTQPLHHYFIASSHQSCLMGNQLDSEVSTDMLKELLLGGCRCLDLDCWDGLYGEPVVTRAYTRCGVIFFHDAIACINEWAFATSCFPLIICLGVHASPVQQAKMAEILKVELEDQLWVPPSKSMMAGWSWWNEDNFSPDALRNKILLKCRMNQEFCSEGEYTPDERDLGNMPEEVLVAASHSTESAELHPDLLALVSLKAVRRSRHFNGAKEFPTDVISLTDEQLAQKEPGVVSELAQHSLIFAYPAGKWMQSENVDPQDAWMQGCQMLAMNWQTKDYHMRVYQSFFQRNGRCGYCLKPAFCRGEKATSSREPFSLLVHVLAGQQLIHCGRRKGDVLNPYVQLRLSGHPKDAIPGEVFGEAPETKVVPNNALNPQFDETFKLRIYHPEVAILSLLVYDYEAAGSTVVGEAHIPVDLLSQGFRRVPLYSPKDSTLIPCSSLFCRFELTLQQRNKLRR